MKTTTVPIDRAVMVARTVRAELLSRTGVDRNLAGHCGLAAMRVAAALEAPGALRVGFYMRRETLCGRRGRYPNRHAWCQVEGTIVDPTATQFGRHRAVHVVAADEDDRYVETADGADAIDDIMINWRGCELAEYAQLARSLRRKYR